MSFVRSTEMLSNESGQPKRMRRQCLEAKAHKTG